MSTEGLKTTGVDDSTCCFAEKTDTRVHDPYGARWEVYVKKADAEQMGNTVHTEGEAVQCCATAASEPASLGAAPSA